jgi:hypothetical protein
LKIHPSQKLFVEAADQGSELRLTNERQFSTEGNEGNEERPSSVAECEGRKIGAEKSISFSSFCRHFSALAS